MSAPRLLVACVLAVPLVAPVGRALADDGGAATPPAPPALIEQTDRRKMVSIKIPREFKAMPGDQADEKALASLTGFFGEAQKSPPGLVFMYVVNEFARATLARAIALPQVGAVKPAAARQGPGWAEGCAIDAQHHQAEWRRYVEKNGRVYMFRVVGLENDADTINAQVQQILDTAVVTGDFAPPALQPGWTLKKVGEFDVVTDASADREKSVAKQKDLLAAGRDVLVKALPGKPFDASRPSAWLFQNATKYEEKLKASIGVAPQFGTYDGVARSAVVEMMSETRDGHDGAVYNAGAAQYVWQYFGGATPPWISLGLSTYGQVLAGAGSKGKLVPEVLTKTKSGVAAGKRKLNEWFDVASTSEVVDVDQGAFELFAWHTYFRTGRGVKKYKKQYDSYLQTLRDTGDPAAARKSFDGANFDEMLQDFKAWAADWK